MPDQTLSEELGQLVAETAEISPHARERVLVSLVHNFTMALAGRNRERVAHVAAETAWSQPGEATLWATGARVSRDGAAFANAALMHARSQDDTHPGSTSHPGAPVMAAGFALAEALGCSGAECLTALVLGYEAIARIGRGVDRAITARGFRAASVLGVFGATATAARLMGLSAAQSAHALGLAAQMAGGLSQVWEEGSAEYPLQLGFAARNGIAAAIAAQAGATAARAIFEGRLGVFAAYAGARQEPAGAGGWAVTEATVKAYPVCAVLQGPVEALLRACRRDEIRPEDVREVRLFLSPFEATFPGIDNPGPFPNAISTKMSAQFSLGLALAEGHVTLEGLGNVNDARVLELARHVRVVAEPSLEPRLSRIEITDAHDRRRVEEVTTPAGRPSFPEVCDAARAMRSETGLESDELDRLFDAIKGLDRAPDVHALIACLTPSRGAS